MRGELGLNFAGGTKRGLIQRVEILANRAGRVGRVNPCGVPLLLRRRVLLVRIRLDQAGIHRHALTTDQTLRDAACDGRLEQVAEQLAIAEPAVAILGEGRVIRHPVGQIQAAEPAIRQVQMHFLAQPPFRPDAETVSDQQHPDQKFWIDRWPPRMTVEIREVGADAAQVDEAINGPQQVILRDVILEGELVEQSRLRLLPRSHHRRSSHPMEELNQPDAPRSSPSFSTK